MGDANIIFAEHHQARGMTQLALETVPQIYAVALVVVQEALVERHPIHLVALEATILSNDIEVPSS